MELILENVRCFVGKHTIPIKPLTVLIGENSTGKSTLLAFLSIVCKTTGLLYNTNFNETPYNLGTFDTIASSQNGKSVRAKYFSFGLTYKNDTAQVIAELIATYRNQRGQPKLHQLSANNPKGWLKAEVDESGKYQYKFEGESGEDIVADGTELYDVLFLRALYALTRIFPPIETLSIAPVRTKPQRTYDEFIEKFHPEGEHIPFILARVLNEKSNSKQQKCLISALKRFGKNSGLFDNVEIRKLGDNPGDPFQVMVTVAGRPANILDVGYGVSQALPVVVQIVLAAKERLLLLQQPEVHLHPKAQAALGSFFLDMVADSGKQFVIETHSDYIVDRIRQEVAIGKIKSDDVALLFFEKNGVETTVHDLKLDKSGNITNAPPSYRAFFLREELNLLTRTGATNDVFDN